jgi:hypothetical protein
MTQPHLAIGDWRLATLQPGDLLIAVPTGHAGFVRRTIHQPPAD